MNIEFSRAFKECWPDTVKYEFGSIGRQNVLKYHLSVVTEPHSRMDD